MELAGDSAPLFFCRRVSRSLVQSRELAALFLLEFAEKSKNIREKQQIDASNNEDVERQWVFGGVMESNKAMKTEADQGRQHAASDPMPRTRRHNREKVVSEKRSRRPGRKNDNRDPYQIETGRDGRQPGKIKPSARGSGARDDDRYEQRIEKKCYQTCLRHHCKPGDALWVGREGKECRDRKAQTDPGEDFLFLIQPLILRIHIC